MCLHGMHSAFRSAAYMPLCTFSLQLKLEDRSVVPRDVVRHMRSTVSLVPMPSWVLSLLLPLLFGRELPGWGVEGLGNIWVGLLWQPCGVFISSLGQSVWHSDRCQH